MIEVRSEDEIRRMERAGEIVARTLEALKEMVAPGVSTMDLEDRAEAVIAEAGGKPAFKGYRGYPAIICSSVNDQVVHGIPSKKRVLREGDIVSIDLGVVYDGFYGDAALTVPVGNVDPEVQRLLDVTKQALAVALPEAREGARVSDIGHAVQSYVESEGFSVVRHFVGHGIGKKLHEEPQVPNFGKPGSGQRLKSGMTLAIEPMVNAGGFDVKVLDDGWTAVTADGSLSAHFEHTVLVTADGGRPLTIKKD
ncbi:MAG: type I methionyl aminopeptidase [Thermodesulfovibrionales bacterium]|nr:type I methionyl aminopeptidase [Thermodesulfovibrionales bacterium]